MEEDRLFPTFLVQIEDSDPEEHPTLNFLAKKKKKEKKTTKPTNQILRLKLKHKNELIY